MPDTLAIGSTGPDVVLLQNTLNASPPTALPPLLADGYFGVVTQARVEEYQEHNGLVVDGIVGPITWAALLEQAPPARQTFYVQGRRLYDRLGNQVVLRGVNRMSVWDNDHPDGAFYFPEIRKTGANCVRIVWLTAFDNGTPTDLNLLDALIGNARRNHLIPMIELHDATGDWSRLPALVNYWVRPDVCNIIQKHQQYLLVNIGNEVGDDTVTAPQFSAGYTAAVQALRGAGIHTPLVIDAPDWGKNLDVLNAAAAALLAADPDHNLVFSVHLYRAVSCGYDANYIRAQLQAAVALGYPLIVGEFSEYGAEPCGNAPNGICGDDARIDYRAIIEECQKQEIGWLAWEWGPGNAFGGPGCDVMDMTPDCLFASLKPGWPTEVALSSPFSIQHTSITPPTM